MTTTQGSTSSDESTQTPVDAGPRSHVGRTGYPHALRERAASMRREGMTRAVIARDLGIGFSTVARWFRQDRVEPARDGSTGRELFRESYRRTVEERWALQQVEQDAHRDAVGPLTERELLLVGAALYWAEGSKAKPWRRHHVVRFINSDPTMITAFLAYLRVIGVPRPRVKCRLSIHESADIEAATAYWRNVVGEDLVFQRPTIKKHNPTSVRHNTGETYAGCLVLALLEGGSTYRRIAGTWQGIAAGAQKQ